TALLSKVKPAIDAETVTRVDRSGKNPVFVENVASLNVRLTLKEIVKRSPIIHDLVKQGSIALTGAMYNVETGVVDFFLNDEQIAVEKVAAKANAVY
ncbi:MAG TPA: carbonic anhydrase, partial [Ohtaekwangia sp.]|nr:carbonic anhydrase [Ohtaekwangia sp.]